MTKDRLRKIIKEEKSRILSEQSQIKKEAYLLGTLDSIASSIEEIAGGIWGQDDELAQDLEMQVERLTDFYRSLTTHFEQQDEELGRR